MPNQLTSILDKLVNDTSIYFADDETRNPTIVLINQTNRNVQALLARYDTVFTNYLLVLNNPPLDMSTVINYNIAIKNAYAMFLPSSIAASGSSTTASGTTGSSTTGSSTAGSSTVTSNNTLQKAIDNYNTTLSNARITLESISAQLNSDITNLRTLIKQVVPKANANRARVDAGVGTLLAKIDEMQDVFNEYKQLVIDEPAQFDDNYENSKIKTKSNFFKYILYLFFAIFVIGSLCLLHFFPSSAYLDMFIMALAGVIIVYYGYDYFENRNNTKV